MKRTLIISVLAILVLMLLAASEEARLLALGWIDFLRATLPRVRVNPVGVVSGLVAVGLFVVLADQFARWCCRSAAREGTIPRRWRFRWTLSILLTLVLMFVTGYSAIGLARQLGWLFTSKEPLYGERSAYDWPSSSSTGNLRYAAMGLLSYGDHRKAFPAGGTFREDGTPMHGWATMMLPYLNYWTEIRMDLPWNHPENARHFRTVLPELVNPDFRTQELFDPEGFGLAHYAANCRAMGANSSMTMEDLPDGGANTILIGEVRANFAPWGSPVNWRDPTLGINRSPDGFGGPTPNGAYLLMADGSTRFLSDQTDPEVLKALASPGGRER